MTQQPPQPAQQEVLGDLARWLVSAFPAEPGWDEMHLQLRPLRDEVRFRVIEIRGEERTGRLGRLTPEQAPYNLARRLQEVSATPEKGTWIEASLTLSATQEPESTFTVTGRFNRDSDPKPWQPEEAPLDATDLVHHLTRFPREPHAVPDWMAQRITAAGLAVPGAESADPSRSAAPADGSPDEPAAVASIAPASAGERAPLEALEVVVDRDGPTRADGSRPGRRRLRLGGSLRLADVLETIGIPLAFIDDRGTWIVRHGQDRDSGPVLAVVEQGPGASTGAVPRARIHLLTEAQPADLVDDAGRLHLYYCSVPGELEVVLDSARLGEVVPPPAPVTPPDNALVRDAVAEFAAEPGPQRMLHVLRQVLGGRLVVDASGSEVPEPGTASPQLRLTTLTAPDGGRALGVFTSNTALVEFRKKIAEEGAGPQKVTGVAQPGPALLEMFRRTEELTWFIVDPGGPSCAIGRREVELALSAPSAVAVKNLLAEEHTAQELVNALTEAGHLFLAHTETEGRSGPVLVRDRNDDKPVLLAFTSPVEIAAYNTSFGARRVPVGAVLELALANRAKAVLIDPAGPRGALTSAQVWHALGNPELPPPPESSADDAGGGTTP